MSKINNNNNDKNKNNDENGTIKAGVGNGIAVVKNDFYSITHVDGMAVQLKNMLMRNLNIGLKSKQVKCVGNLFSKLKSRIDKCSQSNVIYKIPCEDCPAQYTGQTKRYLKTRLQEHERNCSHYRGTTGKCAPVDHAVTNGHSFNFEEARILYTQSNLYKRLTLEML